MTRQEERQHERKGIILAIIFHGSLLLLFFFWIVLKQSPNESGTGMPGINIGFNELGSGDNNSIDPVATQTEQATEQTETTEATDEAIPVSDDANLTTSNPNAETVVSETKKAQTTSTAVKQTQTTSQTSATNTNAQQGTTTKTGVSSGDGDSKQAGNQGDPKGSLDSKNYYGAPGPGDGGTGNNSALSMDGWHLSSEPKVANIEKESGKVSFIVKIDSEGEIISLIVKEKQVSEVLVKRCADEIRNKTEFIKNKNNGSTAATSTGTITFVFRVN
jgi:protein TonB